MKKIFFKKIIILHNYFDSKTKNIKQIKNSIALIDFFTNK